MTTSTARKPDAAPAVEPAAAAMVDIRGVAAEYLDCSTQHVRRLNDAGRMPKAIRVGSLLRWRRTDIENWIAAGCPNCRDRGAR
jgi:excisionase family DNA binding protein